MRRNLGAAKLVNAATQYDIKLELDVRCQKLIERRLRRAFPRIALLGEEGDSGSVQEQYRWVVDPIDGTVNYAYGIPHACVSIALQMRSAEREARNARTRRDRLLGARRNTEHVTLLGVVYDPFTDELWTATRGGPARLNGRVIRASRRSKLAEALVSVGFAKSRHSLERALPYFAWLSRRVRKARILGAAALGLTYVATGRLDAYIERGINLWDVVAGVLIIERAGGKVWLKRVPGSRRLRLVASNAPLHDKFPRPR